MTGAVKVPGRASELSRLSWVDLGSGRHLLVVPVGSCEQHGPHLPLDTDTLIAQAFATDLAARRDDALVAPALAIGASGEHRDFPGTLSIGTTALTATLVELARSALPEPGSGSPAPFAAVLFVNAHGGNAMALAEALSRLQAESRRVGVWHPTLQSGDPHAGETETSLMLHLHPDRVRMEFAEPGSAARFSDIRDELTTGGLAAVTPNGVLGDPTAASAELGRRLFETLRMTLADVADELL